MKAVSDSVTSKIFPGKIWNDTDGIPIQAHGGGMLFYRDRYYWYGENKDAPTEEGGACGFRVPVIGISCYSSANLTQWKNEGLVLGANPDNPRHDLYPKNVLERPKVLFNKRTKKFVMWMHVDRADYGLAAVGIASAVSPTGPFFYHGCFRPGGEDSRDLTVFADSKGNAWSFHTSENNATMHIRRLTRDFLGVEPGICVKAFPKQFREAPAVFCWGKKYYMFSSGCTGWRPNEAQVAVADHPMGEWKLLGNPCIGPEADKTFFAQSTFVFPLAGKKKKFVAMFDQWEKTNLGASRYVWLPIELQNGIPSVQWQESWEPNH